MKIDPNGSYFKPLSIPQRPIKAGMFEDVWFIAATYETNKDAMVALLPEPYEPDDDPLVTVWYARCPQVNFLAGAGYNMIVVELATFFNGAKDQLRGNYSLILWENQWNPVTRGRDLLGVPKLIADVPDFTRESENWRGEGREHDSMLLSVSVQQAKAQTDSHIAQANEAMNSENWMGWKYIPNIDGKGAAVSHPTRIGRQITIEESWLGEASVTYGDIDGDAHPWTGDIVTALRTLEVKEYRTGTVNHGSMTITRALNRVLE